MIRVKNIHLHLSKILNRYLGQWTNKILLLQNILLLPLFFFITRQATAQENYNPPMNVEVKEYFDWYGHKQNTENYAGFYRIIIYQAPNKPKGIVRDYYTNGILKQEFFASYVDYYNEKNITYQDTTKRYNSRGQLEQVGIYTNDEKQHKQMIYYNTANSTIQTQQCYEQNICISEKTYCNGLLTSLYEYDPIKKIKKEYDGKLMISKEIDNSNSAKIYIKTYLQGKLYEEYYTDSNGRKIDSLKAYRANGQLYYEEYYIEHIPNESNSEKKNYPININKDSGTQNKQIAFESEYFFTAKLNYYDEQRNRVTSGKYNIHNKYVQRSIQFKKGSLSTIIDTINRSYIKTKFKHGYITKILVRGYGYFRAKLIYSKGNTIYAYPYRYTSEKQRERSNGIWRIIATIIPAIISFAILLPIALLATLISLMCGVPWTEGHGGAVFILLFPALVFLAIIGRY